MTEDTSRQTEKAGAAGLRWLGETVLLTATAFVIAMALRATIAEAVWVPSGSMESTIMTYDRALTEKVSFRFREPQPGDVVTLDDPDGVLPMLIKRVIAVGGQTIDLKDGLVYVDGRALDEPYVNGASTEPQSVEMPVTVPEGCVWVMGDNRTNSTDSRTFGAQPISSVHARAIAVYWPPANAHGITD